MDFSRGIGIILSASLSVAVPLGRVWMVLIHLRAALRVKLPHSSAFVVICWTIKTSREQELLELYPG